jgi:low temperature requirement protein LtrA
MASSARPRLRLGDEERVKPLELYFDLIFVFAVTQVTGLIVEDPTWAGLVRGLVVLGVLWWAWTAYAWLTNTVDPDEGVVRITMFGAMGAMLVASLAVPDVFGDDAFLFACMYALVRIAHLVLYAFAGWGDRALLGALSRLGAGTAAGVGLLFVASALDGPLQAGVWALALALDLLGAYIGGGRGWRLSPAHFAERHALVMIIALGESIIAIGAGAPRELGVGVIAAGTLGIAIACTLWWAYFDVVALVAERKLHEAKGTAQLTMARDSYSYLHLPMVAGIVLYAVGVKKTMEHVGDSTSSRTSSSGCATCTRSTASASSSRCCCSDRSRWRRGCPRSRRWLWSQGSASPSSPTSPCASRTRASASGTRRRQPSRRPRPRRRPSRPSSCAPCRPGARAARRASRPSAGRRRC